ncbi:MAG TPA: preprotein translocase subunit YajC [Steroidobacteraceae bacterium]|jgi:preprotein translocase subunit YajC|nr:preprotein translocase subunit YajC [Steroidobacteraceae bacterium]
MDFLISPAWAQAAGAPQGSPLMTVLPLLLIFVVFYFLLIRPQSKRAKEHREMVAKLSAGDEVVTTGGLLGRLTEVGEHFVTLQVASGVSIQVQKFQVAQLVPKGTFKGA